MIIKINGEDKEVVTELEPGEKELDMLTDNNINLIDTLELSIDDLEKINEEVNRNE